MVIQLCTEAFGSIVRFFGRPYEEAVRQRQYALYGLFQTSVSNSDEHFVLPSLTGRITHLVISLLLHPAFFVVSLTLYIAMHHFGWDSGHKFCHAIEEGDLDQLNFFLKIGWNPNQHFLGKPLIFIAQEKGQHTVLKRLLREPTCNPNIFYHGKTLFHLAAQKEDEETVKLLLHSDANPNVKRSGDHYTPAFIAYLEGNPILSLEIIDKANLVNSFVDRRKRTLLNHAWDKGDLQMVTNLIRRGAVPPSVCPISHYEMLIQIYERDKALILSQMIPSGWDVNAVDENGHTLLEHAINQCDWKFAKKLIQNGAHIDTRRSDGTPLITFQQFQYDPSYYCDFLEEPTLFPEHWEEWIKPKNWLRGEVYLDWVVPALVERAKREDSNPLEKVYFLGSELAMQRLACTLTYSEFVEYLVTLSLKYKRRIQTDWIINALYCVDPNHYMEFEDKVVEAEMVELPKKPVFVRKILDEFNKLHDLTKKETTFQGVTYSRKELEKGLIRLISTITHRKKLAGLPANHTERNHLFASMEKMLKQIAYFLYQESTDTLTKRRALLDLAYVGHCARDWHLVLYQVYCLLADRDYQILTFADHVMIELGQFRLQLLQNHIYKGRREEYKYAVNMLAESRALPVKLSDSEEILGDISRTQLEEEHHFDEHYTPDVIVKAILGKRAKDPYFQEHMINYFKDVISKRWIESPFKAIVQEIKKTPNADSLTPKQVQSFFNRYGQFVQEKLNGCDLTLQSGLDYLRFMACYEVVAYIDPKETLPLGTAKMLESLGYFYPKNPNIFHQSFYRTKKEQMLAFFTYYLR